MDEEKYQKELFEFKEKPRRFFPRLSGLLPKGDFERNVILTLTLDRAVFIAIGVIMVMVVIYAMGVEKGRQLPGEALPQTAASVPRPVMDAPVAPNSIAPVKAAPVPLVKAHPTVKASPIVKAPPIVKALPYTIVAVTLSRKDTAVQEAEKLKRMGYIVSIAQSGAYFQVCAGAYADRTGAQSQKDLKNIKRYYKDAYIKSR